MNTPTVCRDCGQEVHPLEIFPKGRCLNCHRPHAEKEFATMTAEKLARMWGAK